MARPKKPRTIREWLTSTNGTDDRWTQERLAEDLGVAQSLVSRWVRGVDAPAQKHWPRLARITGLPVTAFMRPDVAAALGGRA